MVTYEQFGDHVEAHLTYLYSRKPEEIFEALGRRLRDGSWSKAPGAWLVRLAATASQQSLQGAPAVVQLIDGFLDALLEVGIGHEARETLAELFNYDFILSEGQVALVVDLLCKRGGPGEAPIVADLLWRAYMRAFREGTPPWWLPKLWPLAKWLLENGAAELRASRHVHLTAQLAVHAHEVRAPVAEIAMPFRYFALNAGAKIGELVNYGRVPVLAALEAVLGDVDHGLLVHIVEALPGNEGSELVQAILSRREPWSQLLSARRGALRALVRGAFSERVQEFAWKAALDSPFPSDALGSIRTVQCLDAALQALRFVDIGGPPSGEDEDAGFARQRGWGKYLGRECIRIRGLSDIANCPDVNAPRPDRCVGYGYLRGAEAGIREAVEEALLADSSDELSLPRALLRESGATAGILKAALLALPRGGARPPRTANTLPAALMESLERWVRYAWLEPVFGIKVASLLGAATRCELADLPGEAKVEVVADVVRLQRSAIEEAVRAFEGEKEQLAQGVMYLAHELIHLGQGIGDKARVEALRAVGAESTLLHIDLAADHATALSVEQVFPTWTLEWLKDVQGRSLASFPAGRFHTAAARSRKAQRLVSLRVDALLRHVPGRRPQKQDGYLFADFGPGGGRLLVLASGPPFALIGSAELSADEAKKLAGAADEKDADEPSRFDLDATLKALLERLE